VAYIISSIVQFIGGVIFLFYLEWRLGVITLIILPLFVFFARYFADRMHILSHHYMERSANVLQRFEETLVSVPLIKTFTTERREEKRVISAVSDNQQIEMEQSTVNALATLVLKIVPDLARGVVLIAGVYWIILGKWTLGSLLAFQLYLGYVYGPALSLASSNLQFQNALTALERVSTILNSDPEENSINGKVVTHLKGDVRFEHVSFSYNGAENVLEDISFAIQPGEHIAIIGPSGVGKTTLISLLLCFYQPTSGLILFDNISSKEYNLTSLRQRIGYVSQLTQLMEGTIHENLVYGNTTATQIEIDQAARVAGILDTIVHLPQGYDTIVGEKGVNLSEGQKQRLSIARALIKDPDILIMDEPTAALDSLTESLIFETLPTKIRGKTLFMIAHRLSTIKNADRILVLTDKHQSGFGTHAELMENNFYYRSLIENNAF
jgi:ABC-type multidrug transport system fused ATPase/permease subunit